MAAPSQLVGQTLGHYRVVEQIGAGGMGVVYRALDERLDRNVALKVLPPGALADENARKRFRKEALALAKLNHPNIATIHDFDTQDGVEFLVMEYVEGVTLAKKLAEGALPEKQVLEWGEQIAKTLEDAHDRGIVHRDLKPGNIMVTKGQLKLLDFGLAKLLGTSNVATTESLSEIQSAGGTLPYMAPEQLRGEPPDFRSDIYALGVVLYEIATGRRPFDDKPSATLICDILHKPPPPPRQLNQRITLGLENIILKALAKDSKLRYQSACEISVDLRRLAQAPAAVPIPPAQRRLPYRKFFLYGVILSLLFYGIIATVHHLRLLRSPLRGNILVADFDNRTGEPMLDQTPRELLTNALEQSHYVSIFPSSRIPDVLSRMELKDKVHIDEKLAGEICQRQGLPAFIVGSISRIGKRYVLVVRAVSITGRPLATTEKDADDEERIPDIIDTIARTLREALGESLEEVEKHSLPLAQVTSRSLEAVRYYSIGKQSLYAGNPQEAIINFERALEIDPSFAMAHDYLGIASQHVNDYTRAGEHLFRATQLVNKVTETERYKILGDYALYRRDFDHAISYLQALVNLDPNNAAAHINLGESHVGKFEFDAAIKELEESARLQPEDRVLVNLADAYLMKGDSTHALFLIQSVLRTNSTDVNAREYLGRVQLLSGQFSEARHTLESLLSDGGKEQPGVRILLADLAMAEGRYRDAGAQLEAGIVLDSKLQKEHDSAHKKLMLAELQLEQGDTKRFFRIARELESAQPALDIEGTLWLGRLYERAHRPDLIRARLESLEKNERDPTPTLQSFTQLMRAQLGSSMHDWKTAVSSAELAVRFENSTLALEALAHTYRDADKLKDAISAFEQVLLRQNERFDSYDHPALHKVVEDEYWLGVLYEETGQEDKGKEYLGKFLAAWAHPDTELPMYQDAERRATTGTTESKMPP